MAAIEEHPSTDDEELAMDVYQLPDPEEADELDTRTRAARASRCRVALGLGCAAAMLACALHSGGMRLHSMHSLGEEEAITALASTASAEENLAGGEAITALASTGSAEEDAEGSSAHENAAKEKDPCLCAFDIDRTLTCKQGWADQCGGTTEQPGVEDSAFSGGTLVLSQAASNLADTFCGRCHRGIVSAGDAGGEGSGERASILEAVGGVDKTGSDWWQDINYDQNAEASTSLIVHAVDGNKQDSVSAMLQWLRSDKGIDIKDENVWFFDDLLKNVEGFRDSPYNARQISCKSRGPVEQWVEWDGKIGGCGAMVDEIIPTKGVHICHGVPLEPEGLEA